MAALPRISNNALVRVGRHLITIASPATLYGATTSPLAGPVNAAQPAYVWPHPSPTTMEDNDAEPSLVIDIVNIECE